MVAFSKERTPRRDWEYRIVWFAGLTPNKKSQNPAGSGFQKDKIFLKK